MSQEGEYHDFISEHHVLWEAGSKENWEKVCKVVDSQLRPMAYKRLGEPNYRSLESEWANSHGIPWFSDHSWDLWMFNDVFYPPHIMNHVGFINETYVVGVMRLGFPFR